MARLFILLSGILLAGGSVMGCLQSQGSIPAEIIGKYATNDPEYENEYFELSTQLLTIGFAHGNIKYYDVKGVQKKIIDNRLLYTVLCANEAENEEFNFSFFYDSKDKSTIIFKNKPKVSWKRQGMVMSEKRDY